MKVLVIGADGFVGRNVLKAVQEDPNLEVVSASRKSNTDYTIDLLNQESVHTVLNEVNPDVIVNCAGVVLNNEDSYKNGVFCKNIFESIIAAGKPYPRVIITGSAAEYGVVEDVNNSVHEDTPLNATSDYGKSKTEEVLLAQKYAKEYGIDVIVARIFNPIGPGMGEKFLLSSLRRQLEAFQRGEVSDINLSRLDSRRDYVDIRDIASAMHTFIVSTRKDHHVVQNVGSGKLTTNGELIDALLDKVEHTEKPTIIETRDTPEPTYAAKADIRRIEAEFGWKPQYDLSTTMEDIIRG
jgi:nucleoside-diphosphate-sugar epimerase